MAKLTNIPPTCKLKYHERTTTQRKKILEGYSANWIPYGASNRPFSEGWFFVVCEHKRRHDYVRFITLAFFTIGRNKKSKFIGLPTHKKKPLYSVLMFAPIPIPSFPLEAVQPFIAKQLNINYLNFLEHFNNPSERKFYSFDNKTLVRCSLCKCSIEYKRTQDKPQCNHSWLLLPYCPQCMRSPNKVYLGENLAAAGWIEFDTKHQTENYINHKRKLNFQTKNVLDRLKIKTWN